MKKLCTWNPKRQGGLVTVRRVASRAAGVVSYVGIDNRVGFCGFFVHCEREVHMGEVVGGFQPCGSFHEGICGVGRYSRGFLAMVQWFVSLSASFHNFLQLSSNIKFKVAFGERWVWGELEVVVVILMGVVVLLLKFRCALDEEEAISGALTGGTSPIYLEEEARCIVLDF